MSEPVRPALILAVDDDPRMCTLYQRCLGGVFRVSCAESAEEAARLIRITAFDAVISDLQMPGHNGLWLLGAVRDHLPGAMRILVSGCRSSDLHAHMDSGLIQHFLAKPFQPRDLFSLLVAGGLSSRPCAGR